MLDNGGIDYGNYYVVEYGNYHEENYGNYEEFYVEEKEESVDVDERDGVKVIGPRSLSLCLPLSRLECGLLGDTELSNKLLTFIEVNLLSVDDILLDLFVKAGNVRTKDIYEHPTEKAAARFTIVSNSDLDISKRLCEQQSWHPASFIQNPEILQLRVQRRV